MTTPFELQKPKHLYIIGNGFDLHHEINSSYSDFRVWMYENNSDVMNRIDDIYGLCDKDWWSDFENQLASLDALRYGESIAFENQPDLSSDHCDRMWNDAQIEVEQNLESLYADLRACFHDWILQLNKPCGAKKIKISHDCAFFINFNYTTTLEDMYNVRGQNILHIHGCVNSDEDFVLGHGKTYEQIQAMNTEMFPEPPDDLANDELEEFYETQGNTQMLHEQLAVDAAINGVVSQRKPVEVILNKQKGLFNSLSDVSFIHVYGISFSEVDLPYLDYISSISKVARWEFSDYKDFNRDKILDFCTKNNITAYKIIDLNDLLQLKQLTFTFK